MAMTYSQYIAFHRLPSSAASAIEWLRSGQAPGGTVIPEALRQYFGGASVVAGSAMPGAAPSTFDVGSIPGYTPPAPETVATIPGPQKLPTPQNPYLPQLGLILQQVANLPSTYDPQRQAVAANIAAQLQQQGLVDFAPQGTPHLSYDAAGTPSLAYDYTTAYGQPGVGHTYGIVQGADGRAYLQAFTNVAHGAASRGVYSGSQVEAQQQQARQALDFQRANLYAQNQSQQNALTGQQTSAYGNLAQSWADYQSKAASEVPNTVAGWSVTPTTPPQVPQASPGMQIGISALPTNPSPLTQATGGQRTITGAAGPITSTAKSIFQKAKSGGLTTKSTRLT